MDYYIMTFSNSSYRHLLKVFLPDISRAIAVYLGFHLHRLSFSISSLSLCVSLKLKWCTCREHISSVQSLSRFQLFVTPWIAACQASLSIANSRSLLQFISIESVMPSNHLILCCLLLLFYHRSLPASGSFPRSQLFASGGQIIRVSASVSILPMNI